MGPIKAQFAGAATYVTNGTDRSGSVVGAGRDSLSNSRASGELLFSVSPGLEKSTVVEVQLNFSLQGMLAQFSRPAIVQDFSAFLMDQFAENLARHMTGQVASNGATQQALTAGSLLRWKLARIWSGLIQIIRR